MAYWTKFSLGGVLLPFFLMLVFAPDIQERVTGMVQFATVCLPGFVVAVSVVGEQVESGRMPTKRTSLNEFTIIFWAAVILVIFIGLSVFGTVEQSIPKSPSFLPVVGYLTIQLIVTVVIVLTCAKAKSILNRK